jgi:polyhydroxyalkanoate synthesis regulator phasin
LAEQGRKESGDGVLGRLANRGEDAVTRLMDELGRNPRVTDALAKAMEAKGKVDERTRRTLSQVGLAAADEIRDLRGRLEQLESRLAQLEERPDAETSARAGRKPATTTKTPGGTAKSGSGTRPKTGSGTPAKSGTATTRPTGTRSSTPTRTPPGSKSGSTSESGPPA